MYMYSVSKFSFCKTYNVYHMFFLCSLNMRITSPLSVCPSCFVIVYFDIVLLTLHWWKLSCLFHHHCDGELLSTANHDHWAGDIDIQHNTHPLGLLSDPALPPCTVSFIHPYLWYMKYLTNGNKTWQFASWIVFSTSKVSLLQIKSDKMLSEKMTHFRSFKQKTTILTCLCSFT